MKHKKLIFSKKQRRSIIVLMGINCFALFVNYADLDFKLRNHFDHNSEYHYGSDYYYILTNSTDYNEKAEKFWPFVKFIDFSEREKQNSKEKYREVEPYDIRNRFAGLFNEFDHTEFLVYSFFIFLIPTVRRIW